MHINKYQCDLCGAPVADGDDYRSSNRVVLCLRERPPGASGGEVSFTASFGWDTCGERAADLCQQCRLELQKVFLSEVADRWNKKWHT